MTESELLLAIQDELDGTVHTQDTLRGISSLLQENGYEIHGRRGEKVDRRSSARPAVREHPQRPVPKHPWANQKGKLNGDVALERVRGSYILLKRLLKGVNEGYLKDEIARRERLRAAAAYAEKRMQEDLMEDVEPVHPSSLVRTTKAVVRGSSVVLAWVSAAVTSTIMVAFLIAMSPIALVGALAWFIISTPAALMDAYFDGDFFYYRNERERHLAVRLYRWAKEQ